ARLPAGRAQGKSVRAPSRLDPASGAASIRGRSTNQRGQAVSDIRHYSPAEAARRLGVSAKALRLYEQRGLVTPLRTSAGWRAYGPAEMAQAAEVAALRALGLSLAEAARVLGGRAEALEAALADHEASLGRRIGGLSEAVAKMRALRA